MSKQVILEPEAGFKTIDIPDPDQQWLESQILELRTMLEVSRKLNSTLELEALLSIIIEVATEVINTEAASILLLDDKTGQLHFEAVTGDRRAEVKSVVVPLKGSIAGWIVSHNEPLVVNDTHLDPRHYDKADRRSQFHTRSILGVPLQVKDKTIGVLEVVNKRDNFAFTEQDVETLETLAAQAAVAIENARLYKDLQDQMVSLKDTQTRLVQSKKLAAIGELVAGVAHELNNPLTSIIGFAELLQRNGMDDRSRDFSQKIATQGHRAASIVGGLLDFARQHPPERRPVQINDVLKSVLDLFTYELHRHQIFLTTQFMPDLPPTMADPHQLQQVFVNLIQNARQALGSGFDSGHLTISTTLRSSAYVYSPEKEQPSVDQENEQAIQIKFQDDGPGISSEQLPCIFDPFFTTKKSGEGTGLGLSVCHGIVSEHGGHIWVESQPGQGTTFIIELPVIPLETPYQDSPLKQTITLLADQVKQVSTRAARILLVDDEKDVLAILLQTLQDAGYQVDAVSDGQVALACLAEVAYDLILCDVRMPGLNGLEVYEQARSLNSDLAQRLVFITGDIVSPTTRDFLDETGARYLVKPFKPSELLKQLQNVLDPQN